MARCKTDETCEIGLCVEGACKTPEVEGERCLENGTAENGTSCPTKYHCVKGKCRETCGEAGPDCVKENDIFVKILDTCEALTDCIADNTYCLRNSCVERGEVGSWCPSELEGLSVPCVVGAICHKNACRATCDLEIECAQEEGHYERYCFDEVPSSYYGVCLTLREAARIGATNRPTPFYVFSVYGILGLLLITGISSASVFGFGLHGLYTKLGLTSKSVEEGEAKFDDEKEGDEGKEQGEYDPDEKNADDFKDEFVEDADAFPRLDEKEGGFEETEADKRYESEAMNSAENGQEQMSEEKPEVEEEPSNPADEDLEQSLSNNEEFDEDPNVKEEETSE